MKSAVCIHCKLCAMCWEMIKLTQMWRIYTTRFRIGLELSKGWLQTCNGIKASLSLSGWKLQLTWTKYWRQIRVDSWKEDWNATLHQVACKKAGKPAMTTSYNVQASFHYSFTKIRKKQLAGWHACHLIIWKGNHLAEPVKLARS